MGIFSPVRHGRSSLLPMPVVFAGGFQSETSRLVLVLSLR